MTKAISIFSCANELHKIAIKRWRIGASASPAVDMFPNQPALAATPPDTPPVTKIETPSGKRAHSHPTGGSILILSK